MWEIRRFYTSAFEDLKSVGISFFPRDGRKLLLVLGYCAVGRQEAGRCQTLIRHVERERDRVKDILETGALTEAV